MKEGGLLDRTLASLTGKKHPKVEKRERISIELGNLRESLRNHERNLGMISEGLERSPGSDGGVGKKFKEQIAKKERELTELI